MSERLIVPSYYDTTQAYSFTKVQIHSSVLSFLRPQLTLTCGEMTPSYLMKRRVQKSPVPALLDGNQDTLV